MTVVGYGASAPNPPYGLRYGLRVSLTKKQLVDSSRHFPRLGLTSGAI
jgi:hypothetical protein